MSDTRDSLVETVQDRIGLPPSPWSIDDPDAWPTYGYDGPLALWDYEQDDARRYFGASGHSRGEWLALADAMVERWQAWRAFIAAAPDDSEPSGPMSQR